MSERERMGRKIDLTGQKFGRLTVIEEAGRDKSRNIKWMCVCECGKETIVRGSNLKNGGTQSCGCLRNKHGMRNTRFYKIWDNAKQRGTNENRPNYEDYVGRGIIFCPRWQDFENFKADMYESYLEHVEEHGEANTTLDRIDNDKRYTPWNCRWATWKVQAANKRPRTEES